ncbi:biopolymer transport protein ExbD [mine drainage metagenome]|uniref:Biopolymer transport protein ExbD n=1 Tax=mine drainage metagenome TaxID=410659 RepID=A0A1J5R2T4_9ZZZZ
MDFRRGRKHEELEINLVPLIDVLLVIIIFLVVSATFSRINELKINLPTADASPQQEKPLVVTVSVNASGHYTVNNTPLADRSVAAIVTAMRKAAGNGKEPTIIINADANTTHQSVINVMEAARQAGYTHITFATQGQSGS